MSVPSDDLDVIVLGAGPAGVVASLRAARLGARTALLTRDELGGMAANDGPVPVRTLAHAARLMREARQLGRYGISAGEPTLDPEYASVGLSEATAGETHDVVVATEAFDSVPRPIIDGRPKGFCKLVVDREDHTILGCHIVGERAVELAQLAALAVASGMKVEQLALVPFSFPTYANALGRAAARAARQLDSRSGPAEEGMASGAGLAADLDD